MLYKCGNERYNLMVHAPEHKAKVVWGCRREDRGGEWNLGAEVWDRDRNDRDHKAGAAKVAATYFGTRSEYVGTYYQTYAPWIRRDDSGNS